MANPIMPDTHTFDPTLPPYPMPDDAPPQLTEFDLKHIEQSRRLACLKAAVQLAENGPGGVAAQAIKNAQKFYQWVKDHQP